MAQIAVNLTVNAAIVLGAGFIAGFLATRPARRTGQSWLLGTVLADLALRMAVEARR